MDLIWHGTASVEVVSDGGRLLFDPFVPFPGSDVPMKLEDFDGFSDILATHGHFDHIYDLPAIVKRNPGAKIYCTKTPYATLRRRGVPENNLKLLQPGDELTLNGFKVRVFHSRHAILSVPPGRVLQMLASPTRKNIPRFVRRHLSHPERDEIVAYQIEADGKTLFLMGSLNLRPEAAYPTGADLLVLPYNGWRDNLQAAVMTIERLRPKRVVLDHYDVTFPPLTAPLDLTPVLDKYPGLVTPMALGKTENV